MSRICGSAIPMQSSSQSPVSPRSGMSPGIERGEGGRGRDRHTTKERVSGGVVMAHEARRVSCIDAVQVNFTLELSAFCGGSETQPCECKCVCVCADTKRANTHQLALPFSLTNTHTHSHTHTHTNTHTHTQTLTSVAASAC